MNHPGRTAWFWRHSDGTAVLFQSDTLLAKLRKIDIQTYKSDVTNCCQAF
jgi:hypothetical protein